MDWDTGQVYVSNQGAVADAPSSFTKERFLRFIREFREGLQYVYRNQLRSNCRLGQYLLKVKLEHLIGFDEELADLLKEKPTDLLDQFSMAAFQAAEDEEIKLPDGEWIQISLEDEGAQAQPIRALVHSHLSRLVAVSGIVINASRKQAKATAVMIMCRSCNATQLLPVRPGFGGAQIPMTCDGQSANPAAQARRDGKCGPDPWLIVADRSRFVDHQSLKLQEDPESIPTGEMPRQMAITLERYLVDKVVPGSRVRALGIYTISQTGGKGAGGGQSAGIQQAYLRVVGLRVEGAGRFNHRFTPDEEAEFLRLAKRADLYDALSGSIAPAIYGHKDIKRAVLCQLFGGSRKVLPDGMKLRGDINLLLLGDPGTAKSQLLKFVEKVSPIGVYTSGKGSSAAGLTASVVKDKTSREFYLEGGAMVLADGGVVCIDEFDKMRVQDRVAIHEAMEQQTISIAKAGITTILNARTSVLAAANPVFGRYDDMRSAAENIEFQSTILSRFDLIFLVKDNLNRELDERIAQHVVDIHRLHLQREVSESEVPLGQLKRYIAYCRWKCAPRLSTSASEILKNHYVTIRSAVKNKEGSQSAIPITVRQLEAIIRITESLAKMSLSPVATEKHVNEAIRLFKVSTYEAATSGVSASETLNEHVLAEIQNAEQLLKRRLPIGSQISEKHVVDDFTKQGVSEFAVRKAIDIMAQRGEIEYRAMKHRIYRKF